MSILFLYNIYSLLSFVRWLYAVDCKRQFAV